MSPEGLPSAPQSDSQSEEEKLSQFKKATIGAGMIAAAMSAVDAHADQVPVNDSNVSSTHEIHVGAELDVKALREVASELGSIFPANPNAPGYEMMVPTKLVEWAGTIGATVNDLEQGVSSGNQELIEMNRSTAASMLTLLQKLETAMGQDSRGEAARNMIASLNLKERLIALAN